MKPKENYLPRIDSPYPNIYRLHFNSLEDMALAFVRIQEYYDGVLFHRKLFHLKDFIHKWKNYYNSASFDYSQRWNGYNVPGKILLKWLDEIEGEKNKRSEKPVVLHAREEAMMQALNSAHPKSDWKNMYFFAVSPAEGPAEERLVTKHECAHGFFTLHRRYRSKMKSLIRALPKDFTERVENFLRFKLYHPSVFSDEMQAYLATDDMERGHIDLKKFKLPATYRPQIEKIKNYYKDFAQRLLESN